MNTRSWLSRKLWTTLSGCGILYAAYWHSVNHLYSFTQPEQFVAVTQMYVTLMYSLSAIVLAYVGVNGALSGWTHRTDATASASASTSLNTSERMFNAKKLDPKDIDPEAEA
jgi:hypothetical protein